MMKRLFFTIACAALVLSAEAAQPRFTYADIAQGRFAQKSVSGLRPMADGERYTVLKGGRIESFRYSDGGADEVLFDAAGTAAAGFTDYTLSADETKILIPTNVKPIYRHSFSADWLVYDRTTKTLARLTPEGGEQQAAFSPDGKKVGFVRGNDLHVADLTTGQVRRITSDGERNKIINGLPDWVYEEEYAFSRAFEFSPDGGRIAWLRFDESRVREFTFMTYGGKLYPEAYTYKYPKAGEANSRVTLHVADLARNAVAAIGTGEEECYLPRLGFTPEGELWFFRVNRLQNRFEVMLQDGKGLVKTIYTETSERYVERPDDETVTFLAGGRLVVMNESSGYKHLYLYERDRKTGEYKLRNAVTRGDWDVTRLVGIAENKAYYLSAEGSPLRRNLWSVGLDGKGKKRLTTGEGTYAISPSAGIKYYISSFSNRSTPLRVTVHTADGTLLRTLEDNAALAARIAEVKLPVKEFITIPGADGTPLNAWVVRPEGFDPAKRYPVLMTQYSGPGSQEVVDRWRVDWEDAVVQYGYVVVCVDGRGTGCRGRDFRQCTYGDLGNREAQDQIAAARWLQAQSWVDGGRIGIYGWSYGGFMALNCILKGADVFKMAIAVAPVTSWRYYDSIYTEIYNGLPQDNPRGYDDNSPLNFAHLLRGKLLIVHGTADDNVHVQNTHEMARALVAAGKQFDMMLYTDDNHSMVPSGRANVRQHMVDYTLQNL